LRIDEIVARTQEAARRAELVVLPEGTLPAYVLGDAQIDDQAVRIAIDRLRALARETETVIVAGAAIRVGTSLRNAGVTIDSDGSLAGAAEKLFLWHFDRRWFEPGERVEPIDTRAGRLGVMICADGRIPTIARALADRGAELLVMPTAWVTSGRDPSALENIQADLLARVRAFENALPFVAANKSGAESGMVLYCGKSQIVEASGTLIAIAGEREETILEGVIELGGASPHRAPRSALPGRSPGAQTTVRIAFSNEPLPDDIDLRLNLLEAAYAIAPGDAGRREALDRALPIAFVCGDAAYDPATLLEARRAGYHLAVWEVDRTSEWVVPVARARAIELRIYVVVFDREARRAFAVDPDGIIVAGTTDALRLATFAFDPRKSAQSVVAPGTDVVDGIERIDAILAAGAGAAR
jgi:predicted amidohydrolase